LIVLKVLMINTAGLTELSIFPTVNNVTTVIQECDVGCLTIRMFDVDVVVKEMS